METQTAYAEHETKLIAPNDWIIQTCSTAGCTVAIRSRAGRQVVAPVCKWCQAGESHVLRPKDEKPKRKAGNIGKIELELV